MNIPNLITTARLVITALVFVCLELAAHYVRQQCESGSIILLFKPTDQQLADLGTKALSTPRIAAITAHFMAPANLEATN